jgi:hypothetical protein
MTEEAPLCVCGKPRKLSGYYRQDTGSYYYVTCGNMDCRKKSRKRPLTVGKKIQVRFGALNNPHKICERPGCGKPVGGVPHSYPRSFCSNKCRISVKQQEQTQSIRIHHIRSEHQREYLSEIYADVKAGATNDEIMNKYNLRPSFVARTIDSAISNRQKEIQDRLHTLSREGK